MDKKDKKPPVEDDFETDEVVWAKVKGFSWWPAVVHEIHRVEKEAPGKKKEYTVYFLGEFSHARLQGSKLKNFEANPDLVPKTNNKLLRDAIDSAKKIVDHDTTYEQEYEKFAEANGLDKNAKRKATEDIEEETQEAQELDGSDAEDSKSKLDKNNKDKKTSEAGKKGSKKVKTDLDKAAAKAAKPKPKRKPAAKTEKRSYKKSKDVSSESSEEDDDDKSSENNEIPVINRGNSFSIDPMIDDWAKKFDDIIKDLLTEGSTPDNQHANFVLLEEIIQELRTSQTDFVSLMHTQLLKKMNFIAYILEKFFVRQKKEIKILDLIKNAVDHYRNELITNAFDISGLKSTHSDQLESRND